MKKTLVLLTALALLTFTACISKDATIKLQETNAPSTNPVPENPGTSSGGITVEKVYSIYSTESGLATGVVLDNWGTLATITEENNVDGKAKVYKVVSGGGDVDNDPSTPATGWGASTACIAFKELGDYQSKYKSISFKIKSADLSTITVKIPEKEKSFALSSGTDLGSGWHQFTIPFSDSAFSGTTAGATEIGIHCGWGNAGTFYITDIIMTEK